MKKYLVNGKGIESIHISEIDTSNNLYENEVLIEAKAWSLNYRDLMVAKGQYGGNSQKSIIPLSDMAGIVKAIGKNVTEWKPGDRVLNAPFKNYPAGNLRSNWIRTFVGGADVDGVLAEEVVYPEDSLVKIPDYLDFSEAATFTVAGLTAWSAVITHGKTKPGEWILLHGTGGVSIFAAQLAQKIGARIIMTTSSNEKADAVKRLFGVNHTVNYKDPNWTKEVKKITNENGVDVIVDVAGGKILSDSLEICNYGARIGVIGVLSGAESNIQIPHLLYRQIKIQGILMESTEELRALMKAMDSLQLKPHIDKSFSFMEVKEAYHYLESQKHIGKIVITK